MKRLQIFMGALCVSMLAGSYAHAEFPSGYSGTPFKGPHYVPGTLEAEDFDEGGEGISWHDATSTNQGSDYRPNCNVDIERHYSIGFTENGEWLNYTIEVNRDGAYTVRTYCCGPNGNGSFHLEVDGQVQTRALPAPVVSDWGDFSQYAEAVIQLKAGKHLFRWHTYGGMNVDRFVFERTGEYSESDIPGNFNYPITKECSNPLFVNFDSPMYGSSGIGNMYTADPSAHVWNIDGREVLYLYASHDMEPAQGCDRMDRYHVFSTEDMVNWTDHGEILNSSQVEWGRPEGGFMWAPDCAYKDGIYYFYFPHPSDTDWGSSWKIGVATSTDPGKGFTVKGYIAGVPAYIDPCVFVDDDGQAYIYNGGGNHCFGGKLKANMVELDGEMTEMQGLVDFHEGAWIHKYNGKYYLSYADNHGDDGNQLRYAVSDSPLGPWTSKDAYVFGTGCYTNHGSIVKFKDRWYAFYHACNYSGVGELRSVCVDELKYDGNGNILPVENWGTPHGGSAIEVGSSEVTINASEYNDGGYHSAWFKKDRGEMKTGNDGGRSYVSDMRKGEWVRYSLNVGKTDKYEIRITVRPLSSGSSLHASINGTECTGTLSASGTGSWQTLSAEGVTIGKSARYIDLRIENGSFDISEIILLPAPPYKGLPYNSNIKVPGTIEAEDFDLGGEGIGFYNGTTGNQNKWTGYRTDDEGKKVDMEQSNDQNTDNHHIRQQYIALNWMNDSKWFNYSVSCEQAGYYTASAMVSNQENSGNRVKLTVGDKEYTSNEHTGLGWTKCALVDFPQTVHFDEGVNVVQMRSGMNVDYMDFKLASIDTDVTEINAEQQVKVTSAAGSIFVKGYDGEVAVYSVSGQQMWRGKVAEEGISVQPGIYIVRCGATSVKIFVR